MTAGGSCFLLWLVVLPLLGAAACVPLSERLSKYVALAFSLVGTVLGALLYARFDAAQSSTMQMTLSVPWMTALNVRFALGVDGLSFAMVLLTKLIVPVAILASWGETRRVRAFMICYLLLDSAMTGTFLATDIFLFYVFWELMLIPMILLIGVWGSHERVYAALKFFLFTFGGSILMLASILWLFMAHNAQLGFYSSDIKSFYHLAFSPDPIFLGLSAQELIFLGFTLAFAVKVPLWPLHTWLPDAHVQAPTGGSIILAAVMLKLGTYGLLRFSIPIAPLAFVRFIPLLVTLSLIGILYGAWVAFQQTDFKKLVAYSSVSHLAFVVLGICTLNSDGLTGAMLQMVNHGLSTGGLFFLVGALYERRHSRAFADFGGLAETMPWYAVFLVFVSLSSMAVPGLNGFVGEFLVLFGAFQASPVAGAIATLGVIFGALYMLVMLKKVLYGEPSSAENRALRDLAPRDWAGLVPLCIIIILLGVSPRLLLGKFEQTLETYFTSTLQPSLPTKVGLATPPEATGGRR